MEWRGVTITNVYIGNFFFVAALGLLITAQWELAFARNGLAYSIFSAFGLFYGGFGAIITPAFGVTEAYGGDTREYNNALGFFVLCELCFRSGEWQIDKLTRVIVWTVFVLMFLIAVLPTNLAYILIFIFVELGFLFIAVSYFAAADGFPEASVITKKVGGANCFVAGLVGWYLTLHLLIKDSIIELPLGDTSRYFTKSRKVE